MAIIYDEKTKRVTSKKPEEIQCINDAYEKLNKLSADRKSLPYMTEGTSCPFTADPRGNFCNVDLAFSTRLQKIKCVLPTLGEENHAAVQGLLNAMSRLDNPMGQAYQNMKDECRTIQTLYLLSNLTDNPRVSDTFYEFAENKELTSPILDQFNELLTGIEQIAGLREGPVAEAIKTDLSKAYRQYHGEDLPDYKPKGQERGNKTRDLTVFFPNFEDQIALQWYTSDKSNWTKSQQDMAPHLNNLEGKTRLMVQYFKEIVNNTLDPAFSAHESKATLPGTDRYALTIVDGKTVEERISQYYRQTNGDPAKFESWYADNKEELGIRIIAQALQKGLNVETFVPDAIGRLPDRPSKLTRSGYEPSLDKPVYLNAWERFFNRFGFFKEKAAQATAYQEMLDARNRVRDNYAHNGAKLYTPALSNDMFFSQCMRTYGFERSDDFITSIATDNPFSLNVLTSKHDRSSLSALGICVMASMGHKIEDIINPNYMPAEKQQIGTMIYEHIAMDPESGSVNRIDPSKNTGDMDWLGKMYFEGSRALISQLDRLTNGIDLSNRQQFYGILPAVTTITQTIQNVTQDYVPCIHGFTQAATNYCPANQADKFVGRYVDKLLDITTFTQHLENYHKACTEIGLPGIDSEGALVNVALGTELLSQVKSQKDQPFSKKVPPAKAGLDMKLEIAENKSIIHMGHQIHQHPEIGPTVNRHARNDALLNNYSRTDNGISFTAPKELEFLIPKQPQKEAGNVMAK